MDETMKSEIENAWRTQPNIPDCTTKSKKPQ